MTNISRCLAVLVLAVCPLALFAQKPDGVEREMSKLPGFEGRPVVHAYRLPDASSIKIDGNLNEPAWKSAIPIREFIQQEPRNGAIATERTEVDRKSTV